MTQSGLAGSVHMLDGQTELVRGPEQVQQVHAAVHTAAYQSVSHSIASFVVVATCPSLTPRASAISTSRGTTARSGSNVLDVRALRSDTRGSGTARRQLAGTARGQLDVDYPKAVSASTAKRRGSQYGPTWGIRGRLRYEASWSRDSSNAHTTVNLNPTISRRSVGTLPNGVSRLLTHRCRSQFFDFSSSGTLPHGAFICRRLTPLRWTYITSKDLRFHT